MNLLLAVAGAVALLSTVAVILQREAVHALLYLIVSFFALALSMLALGAAFAAALEVLVYAGAILVLFVFVVMMLGTEGRAKAPRLPGPKAWIGPVVLSLIIFCELAFALFTAGGGCPAWGQRGAVSPKDVGISLFGPYALGVEIAAFILLSGLVGAYHLGRRPPKRGEGES